MEKEFIWRIETEDQVREWKCVLLDSEVVTYEDGQETNRMKITNPEVKQGVLQIDTVTHIFGMDVPFQLEKNVPYIKLGGKWVLSATSFEERKQKILKDQKLAAYLLVGAGILCGIVCLARYLLTGSMGNWWFLLVMGSIVAMTGYTQYRETKNTIAMLEQEDA